MKADADNNASFGVCRLMIFLLSEEEMAAQRNLFIFSRAYR